MTLWIKICANTSLEDAQFAAEAGADAVGFVFAPSPRRVTQAKVAAIVPHLPPTLEKIGVFVDAPFEEIESTVRACGLTGVQLHFDAAPDLPARIRSRFGSALRILRVVHFDADRAAKELARAVGRDLSPGIANAESGRAGRRGFQLTHSSPEACLRDPNLDAILVDSRTAAAAGGTGQSFDWKLAGQTLFQNGRVRKRCVIAAGGLNPANVAQAIATLHPWGVDVVSGVESEPGRKDPAKVRVFIVNARAAVRA
jgi:phosphoribosylanthranilate isomerase